MDIVKEFPSLKDQPNGAIFNKNKERRYILWRSWDLDGPFLLFIGINPSTADGSKNDPTISRLVKVTKEWDYGGFFIVNLFSWISPKKLYLPAGPKIQEIEFAYLKFASKISEPVFMWGNDGSKHYCLVSQMVELFPEAYCFGQNKNGQPSHPLYLPEPMSLKPFDQDKL